MGVLQQRILSKSEKIKPSKKAEGLKVMNQATVPRVVTTVAAATPTITTVHQPASLSPPQAPQAVVVGISQPLPQHQQTLPKQKPTIAQTSNSLSHVEHGVPGCGTSPEDSHLPHGAGHDQASDPGHGEQSGRGERGGTHSNQLGQAADPGESDWEKYWKRDGDRRNAAGGREADHASAAEDVEAAGSTGAESEAGNAELGGDQCTEYEENY